MKLENRELVEDLISEREDFCQLIEFIHQQLKGENDPYRSVQIETTEGQRYFDRPDFLKSILEAARVAVHIIEQELQKLGVEV